MTLRTLLLVVGFWAVSHAAPTLAPTVSPEENDLAEVKCNRVDIKSLN